MRLLLDLHIVFHCFQAMWGPSPTPLLTWSRERQVVSSKLSFYKWFIFNWILFHARRGVRHQKKPPVYTKLFGVFRDLFRAIGDNLVNLGLLKERQDVFYLTVKEIFIFAEGRAVTNNIPGLVELDQERGVQWIQKGWFGSLSLSSCLPTSLPLPFPLSLSRTILNFCVVGV